MEQIQNYRKLHNARVVIVTFVVMQLENGGRKHAIWRAKSDPVLNIYRTLTKSVTGRLSHCACAAAVVSMRSGRTHGTVCRTRVLLRERMLAGRMIAISKVAFTTGLLAHGKTCFAFVMASRLIIVNLRNTV